MIHITDFTLDNIKNALSKDPIVTCSNVPNIESFWNEIKDLDKFVVTPERRKIYDYFFSEHNPKCIEYFNKFETNVSYPDYPGVLRVISGTDDEGIENGIVAIQELLPFHRDGLAYKNPFQVVMLHAQEYTKGTVTRVMETISAYQEMSDEDKRFCDDLVYEHKNTELRQRIEKQIQRGDDYFPLKSIPSLMNLTDDYFSNIEKPLVVTSLSGQKGLAFCTLRNDSGSIPKFKGMSIKESIKVTKWLDSLIYAKEPYAHQWQNGDILLFDGICTQHSRDPYVDSRRLMHRIQLNLS